MEKEHRCSIWLRRNNKSKHKHIPNFTQCAMSTLLDTFQNMSSLDEMKDVKNKSFYDMSAVKGSTFLDIGSGFGKPVFHSAIQTGCESIGIEIVPARVIFCQDQKYEFEDYYKNKTIKVQSADNL